MDGGDVIVCGSSEEDLLRFYDAHTGEFLDAAALHAGRDQPSLFVQSLRGSPHRNGEVLALTNYRDSAHTLQMVKTNRMTSRATLGDAGPEEDEPGAAAAAPAPPPSLPDLPRATQHLVRDAAHMLCPDPYPRRCDDPLRDVDLSTDDASPEALAAAGLVEGRDDVDPASLLASRLYTRKRNDPGPGAHALADATVVLWPAAGAAQRVVALVHGPILLARLPALHALLRPAVPSDAVSTPGIIPLPPSSGLTAPMLQAALAFAYTDTLRLPDLGDALTTLTTVPRPGASTKDAAQSRTDVAAPAEHPLHAATAHLLGPGPTAAAALRAAPSAAAPFTLPGSVVFRAAAAAAEPTAALPPSPADAGSVAELNAASAHDDDVILDVRFVERYRGRVAGETHAQSQSDAAATHTERAKGPAELQDACADSGGGEFEPVGSLRVAPTAEAVAAADAQVGPASAIGIGGLAAAASSASSHLVRWEAAPHVAAAAAALGIHLPASVDALVATGPTLFATGLPARVAHALAAVHVALRAAAALRLPRLRLLALARASRLVGSATWADVAALAGIHRSPELFRAAAGWLAAALPALRATGAVGPSALPDAALPGPRDGRGEEADALAELTAASRSSAGRQSHDDEAEAALSLERRLTADAYDALLAEGGTSAASACAAAASALHAAGAVPHAFDESRLRGACVSAGAPGGPAIGAVNDAAGGLHFPDLAGYAAAVGLRGPAVEEELGARDAPGPASASRAPGALVRRAARAWRPVAWHTERRRFLPAVLGEEVADGERAFNETTSWLVAEQGAHWLRFVRSLRGSDVGLPGPEASDLVDSLSAPGPMPAADSPDIGPWARHVSDALRAFAPVVPELVRCSLRRRTSGSAAPRDPPPAPGGKGKPLGAADALALLEERTLRFLADPTARAASAGPARAAAVLAASGVPVRAVARAARARKAEGRPLVDAAALAAALASPRPAGPPSDADLAQAEPVVSGLSPSHRVRDEAARWTRHLRDAAMAGLSALLREAESAADLQADRRWPSLGLAARVAAARGGGRERSAAGTFAALGPVLSVAAAAVEIRGLAGALVLALGAEVSAAEEDFAAAQRRGGPVPGETASAASAAAAAAAASQGGGGPAPGAAAASAAAAPSPSPGASAPSRPFVTHAARPRFPSAVHGLGGVAGVSGLPLGPGGRFMVLLGGENTTQNLTTRPLTVLDTATRRWSRLPAAGASPSVLSYNSAAPLLTPSGFHPAACLAAGPDEAAAPGPRPAARRPDPGPGDPLPPELAARSAAFPQPRFAVVTGRSPSRAAGQAFLLDLESLTWTSVSPRCGSAGEEYEGHHPLQRTNHTLVDVSPVTAPAWALSPERALAAAAAGESPGPRSRTDVTADVGRAAGWLSPGDEISASGGLPDWAEPAPGAATADDGAEGAGSALAPFDPSEYDGLDDEEAGRRAEAALPAELLEPVETVHTLLQYGGSNPVGRFTGDSFASRLDVLRLTALHSTCLVPVRGADGRVRGFRARVHTAASAVWLRPAEVGPRPSDRLGHAAASVRLPDSEGGTAMLVHGGSSARFLYNDFAAATASPDGRTVTWHRASGRGAVLTHRYGHRAVAAGARTVLFTGGAAAMGHDSGVTVGVVHRVRTLPEAVAAGVAEDRYVVTLSGVAAGLYMPPDPVTRAAVALVPAPARTPGVSAQLLVFGGQAWITAPEHRTETTDSRASANTARLSLFFRGGRDAEELAGVIAPLCRGPAAAFPDLLDATDDDAGLDTARPGSDDVAWSLRSPLPLAPQTPPDGHPESSDLALRAVGLLPGSALALAPSRLWGIPVRAGTAAGPDAARRGRPHGPPFASLIAQLQRAHRGADATSPAMEEVPPVPTDHPVGLWDAPMTWRSGASGDPARCVEVPDGALAADLTSLLDGGAPSADLWLEAVDDPGSPRVPAHRWMLAARSARFRRVLGSSLAEGSADVVRMPGVSQPALHRLVAFFYRDGVAASLRPDEAMELLAAAKACTEDRLARLCEAVLTRVLDADNAAALLQFADHHGCSDLRGAAMAHILAHHEEVTRSGDLDMLPEALRAELAAVWTTVRHAFAVEAAGGAGELPEDEASDGEEEADREEAPDGGETSDGEETSDGDEADW